MKTLTIATILFCAMSCSSKRTNTEASREATYVEKGDTIDPRVGKGDGTLGEKYMETESPDTTKEIEQQL